MKGFCKYFTKGIVALILITVPALCLALDAPSSPLWDMFKDLSFNPPADDLSVAFLGKMFGAVPGVPALATSGSTIIGAIFGVFNAGVLALSGVFLSYTITKILTETTMDGAAMGKSTTIWTAVRCSLSTSLLVPQASGYSMINGIIMWVVVQSVGLADLTWNRALDYLKEGGSLFASPSALVDYTLVNYDLKFDPASGEKAKINKSSVANAVGSADVLRSLTCAYLVQGALAKKQSKRRNFLEKKAEKNDGQLSNSTESMDLQGVSTTIPDQSEIFSLYKNLDNKGIFVFPYINNETDYKDNGKTESPLVYYGLRNMPRNLTGLCGTISYNVVGESKDSDASKRYMPHKLKGLEDMVASLAPTAKRIARDIKLKDGTRELNYKTYLLVGTPGGDDSSKKYLFKNKDLSGGALFVGGNPKNPGSSNLTSDVWRNNTSAVPADANWPYGAGQMLQAAAAYQTAVAGAQGVPAESGSREQAAAVFAKSKFDAAKKQGWIGAGGYYRTLIDVQNAVKKEYTHYRLTGYKDQNTKFKKSEIAMSRASTEGGPGTFVLFNRVFERKNNPLLVIDPPASPNDFSGTYYENMKQAMQWIYLAYPYAKVRGEIASSGSSAISSGISSSVKSKGGALGWDDDTTKRIGGWLNAHVGKITTGEVLGKLIAGSIMLPIPFVAVGAIPLLMPIPLNYLNIDVDNIFTTWFAEMESDKDPILKLKNLGDSMMENSAEFLFQIQGFFIATTISLSIGLFILQAISMGVATCSFMGSCVGASILLDTMVNIMIAFLTLVQTLTFLYIPLGMAVVGPLFVTGAMLAIYVPMIPYLLFLFGAMSWLISVLVLMASAPIICFLMLWGNSSQENPLLSREAEQFVMQIVGIFFRPTLMIIGLIAGMVLAHIGVDILNLGFFNAVTVVITGDESDVVKLFKQVGIMSIYTFTMLAVINMSYSTIYLLYSEVMRIAGITAPAVGLEAQQLEGVKGAATQIAEAGFAGAKDSTLAGKGAVLKFKRATSSEKKQEKQKPGGAKGVEGDAADADDGND